MEVAKYANSNSLKKGFIHAIGNITEKLNTDKTMTTITTYKRKRKR